MCYGIYAEPHEEGAGRRFWKEEEIESLLGTQLGPLEVGELKGVVTEPTDVQHVVLPLSGPRRNIETCFDHSPEGLLASRRNETPGALERLISRVHTGHG